MKLDIDDSIIKGMIKRELELKLMPLASEFRRLEEKITEIEWILRILRQKK